MIRPTLTHTRVLPDQNYRVLTGVRALNSRGHGLILVWSEVNPVWHIWSEVTLFWEVLSEVKHFGLENLIRGGFECTWVWSEGVSKALAYEQIFSFAFVFFLMSRQHKGYTTSQKEISVLSRLIWSPSPSIRAIQDKRVQPLPSSESLYKN